MVKYQIRKRWRHDEELKHSYNRPWTKTLLDMDESACLGRTPLNWTLLTIFYTIFYTVLACLFAICMYVFRDNIDEDVPRVPMKQPGFSFAPTYMVDSSAMLKYNENDMDEIKAILKKIADMHDKYGADGHTHFVPCTPNDDYGYTHRNPCIFLKVNRLIGFKTQPYENIFDLPRGAPSELKDHVGSLEEEEQKGRIWISCETNMSQELQMGYYPKRYVRTSVIEIDKKKKYDKTRHDLPETAFYSDLDFERIVAVQLKNVPPDIDVKVSCYMWAKNIVHDETGYIGMGLIKFMLKIDTSAVSRSVDGQHNRLFL